MTGFGVQNERPTVALPSPYLGIEPGDTKEFLIRWKSVIELMDRLYSWSGLIVKDHMIRMDLLNSERTMLSKYLDAMTKYDRSKKEIFLEMCEFFSLKLKTGPPLRM